MRDNNETDNKTYSMRPLGPLSEVYPTVYTTRAASHAVPKLAAGTGKRRPAMKRVVRKGVRFSVKLAWARWAICDMKKIPLISFIHLTYSESLAAPLSSFLSHSFLQGGKEPTAVQPVRSRVLLGLLRRGVAVWVADAARLAGVDRLNAMPEVHGPSRGGDGQDVAVALLSAKPVALPLKCLMLMAGQSGQLTRSRWTAQGGGPF